MYSFELHRQVDAIQMGAHDIWLYNEVDKMHTGCNLKTTELLDCAHIWACAVIRSNAAYRENVRVYIALYKCGINRLRQEKYGFGAKGNSKDPE